MSSATKHKLKTDVLLGRSREEEKKTRSGKKNSVSSTRAVSKLPQAHLCYASVPQFDNIRELGLLWRIPYKTVVAGGVPE